MMISVIIPVYNAEKYIDRCINSILAQTYNDWELFLIDDGSQDSSLKIIKEYEQKDSRITVVHQENKGAGAARNKGLDVVSGEYVVFVDSDDYIEQQYFEILTKHDEDIVFIDVNRRDEDGKIIAEEKLSMLKGMSKDDILRGQMTGKILWGGVRKAAKRQLLNENSIKYSQHKIGEEAIYSFLLLYYAQSFSFIDTPVYNYEVHSESLSQSFQVDPWGEVAIALKDIICELGCYEEYADSLNSFFVTAAIVSLSKIAKKVSYRQFKNLAYKKMIATKKLINDNFIIDRKHMNVKARILLPFVNKKMWFIIYCVANFR